MGDYPVVESPVVEPAECPADTMNILIVCTGNICRSPLAEKLLQSRLTAAGIPAIVTSAGTRAMVDHPMTDEAAFLATQHGAEPTPHAAQQLTADRIAAADLILTATREHRGEVVSLHPRANRYAYTLNQFARLVADFPAVEPPVVEPVDTPTITNFLAEINATKGLALPPAHPGDDDIEDPYRRSAEVYDRVGHIIDNAVTTIATALATTTGRG
ncbi:low molecular weight phosphatase family protein [Cryobacterium sp. TMT2-14]|uniref:arsenate reductase/protein-tyrosine-phosphatase family protein n=1 Tax=Cryobacterium sp. TMT2-14 TaxID=1259245 RepID=UPI00106D5194|nr:low molecular weight phosphatase family protein [Cryobacterium sp. TMT2-14]TFC33850.1 low molecular weight phosphatase family protein [Cryobacterium sp. TMT2-14]